MKELPAKRLLSPGKSKFPLYFFVPALFLFTGIIFYLDLVTKDIVAFDLFYFPSILMAVWYLGRNGGLLMAVIAFGMWFGAHREVAGRQDVRFFLDGSVHLAIFLLVAWMAYLVRQKTRLLDEKSRELARSNEELEKFACRAAHDLRSPLATIQGFAEILEEKQKAAGDEEAKECTMHIKKSIKRMGSFITGLLNYAKVMTPEAPSVPVAFDKIVSETLEGLQFQILEKKAQVTAGPLPVLPAAPELISLLFQNLIGNALKYCDKEPRVHIQAVRKGREWIFSVRDNGIGVPAEAHRRIFVMFEKVGSLKYPGNGIGLATCQKIVERYRGRLWVESPATSGDEALGLTAGEGSVFYFTLPVV